MTVFAAITMLLLLGAVAVPVSAQITAPANVDSSTSKALSKYFHMHKLPMVGAQVSTTADGKRHLMLYGYTATEFGKHDAEQKARDYLHEPNIVVNNRIQVDPRLGHRGHATAPPPAYDQSAQDQGAAPAPADWENQVDDMLRRGGASPSNDPNLNMPAPGGPAPAPPGEHW